MSKKVALVLGQALLLYIRRAFEAQGALPMTAFLIVTRDPETGAEIEPTLSNIPWEGADKDAYRSKVTMASKALDALGVFFAFESPQGLRIDYEHRDLGTKTWMADVTHKKLGPFTEVRQKGHGFLAHLN